VGLTAELDILKYRQIRAPIDSSLRHLVQTCSGVHPVGTGDFSQGVNRPELEAVHSAPSGTEVKNARNYTSSPYVFVAQCLIKQKDTFTCFIFLPEIKATMLNLEQASKGK
jgi:hypothetical protein